MLLFKKQKQTLTLFPPSPPPFRPRFFPSSTTRHLESGDDANAKSTETPPGKHVIYEVGVRPFTAAGGFDKKGDSEALRGTFAGLAARAPYLASLGVTAVELLPIFEYDELEFRCVRSSLSLSLSLFVFFSSAKEKGEREIQKTHSFLSFSL
jgi:hypothetical protein